MGAIAGMARSYRGYGVGPAAESRQARGGKAARARWNQMRCGPLRSEIWLFRVQKS